jgi:hypothetical protein
MAMNSSFDYNLDDDRIYIDDAHAILSTTTTMTCRSSLFTQVYPIRSNR